MKKFLSLVLAMIMTLSLVTISAGATEYKDLSDKDEIQYEEAVAVLNRIGIITGYEDGTFRPETELTRGAAAKIIVSLLIGPDAANALPNASSPYPDVPASHTFAGVISYCKTAGIISGYGDGTFKPANSLTGFAFAKMLLGAVGYKSDIEGFTDTGWTMNVAKIGNLAGLFNRLNFDGSAAVNREQACQLALNTLKATMVEYTGGFNVTAGDATVVGAQTRSYVTSNQEYAKNIDNRKVSEAGNANVNNHYTVEFGEEHFKDLRLDDEHKSEKDAFGRPSNVWSYKKVTIGTFAVEPDFVYTTQVAHNVKTVTEASKVRALGLNGYETESNDRDEVQDKTILWVNGYKVGVLPKVADIADMTDEGTVVEVYVSDSDADFITDVVVVKTQLMEIKKVGTDYVSLELYDDGSSLKGDDGVGLAQETDAFNSEPINVEVEDVEVNDECYEALKAMKAGDLVAVIPVSTDNGNTEYEVNRFYVPETVSGELTRAETYNATSTRTNKNTINVTVGGTEYKVALWSKKLIDIDSDKIKVTRKDVTLYLDEFGNAMLAKDVGETSDWMVIGNYRTGLENGILVTYANGWDIKGNEVTLNIGSAKDLSTWRKIYPEGSLVHYTSAKESNTADWDINDRGIYDVRQEPINGTPYDIKSSNTRIALADPDRTKWFVEDHKYMYQGIENLGATSPAGMAYIDSGIKFIYISRDADGEVDSFEIKSGMQNVTSKEIYDSENKFGRPVAQACVSLSGDNNDVTENSVVKAVVIKKESNDATINNLLYIRDYHGSYTKTADGMVQGYEVSMMTSEGLKEEVIYAYRSLEKGEFARYTKTATPESASGVKGVTDDNFYTLRGYDQRKKAASVMNAVLAEYDGDTNPYPTTKNKNLVYVSNLSQTARDNELFANIESQYWDGQNVGSNDFLNIGDETATNLVNLRGAKWVDLTARGNIDSADDLYDYVIGDEGPVKEEEKDTTKWYNKISVALLFNDKIDHDDFRSVYMIVITDIESARKDGGSTGDQTGKYNLTLTGDWKNTTVWNNAGNTQYLADVTTTMAGNISVYPKGDKFAAGSVINIKLDSSLAVADGTYTVNGERLTVKDDILTVTMNADKALDIATFTTNASATQTFTITAEDGIEITALKDNTGADIDMSTVEKNADGTEYYVPVGSNLEEIFVKTTNTPYAFAYKTAIDAIGKGNTETDGVANTGTARKIDLGTVNTDDITIYGAVEVTLDNDVSSMCFGLPTANDVVDKNGVTSDADSLVYGGTYYVRPNTTLNVNMGWQDNGKPENVIAREDGGTETLTVDDVTKTVAIGTKDVNIIGAYQIEKVFLDDVVAVKGSSKADVKDWGWIAADAEVSTAAADLPEKYAGVLVGGRLASNVELGLVDITAGDYTDNDDTNGEWYAADCGENIAVTQNLQLIGVVSIENTANDSAIDNIQFKRGNDTWGTLVASWTAKVYVNAGITLRIVGTAANTTGFDVEKPGGGRYPGEKTGAVVGDGTTNPAMVDLPNLSMSVDISVKS